MPGKIGGRRSHTPEEDQAAQAPAAASGGDDFRAPPRQDDGLTPTTFETADPPGAFDEDHPFDWRTKFRTDAVSAVEKWADDFGVSKFALDAYVRDNMQKALNYIQINVAAPNAMMQARRPDGSIDTARLGPWSPSSPADWDQIWRAGLASFSMQLGFDLSAPPQATGSGRSGSRGPTAGEIRAMFDEDQLTDAVNSLWQGWLVEDAPDARSIAKSYINEIVRTRGEQEIDFGTYVTNKIKKTPRHGLIYKNKPDGVSEQQFLQPYVQSATAIMGGGAGVKEAVADVAVGGAALGASGEAFRNRLRRTDANKNSQGFIRGLEDRVRGVSDLLRG